MQLERFLQCESSQLCSRFQRLCFVNMTSSIALFNRLYKFWSSYAATVIGMWQPYEYCVSSCGYVWKCAKSKTGDPLLVTNIYCSYLGLQTRFRPGRSAVLLENSTQNSHSNKLMGVARK